MSSWLPLKPFALPARDLVRSLAVRVERTPSGLLHLQYRLEGDLAHVRVPALRAQRQVDELWKHTCFEAFVAQDAADGYRELNFAPSTEWAAYAFTGYRAGMAPMSMPAPDIRVEATRTRLALSVHVDLGALTPKLRIAIATVLEDDAGAITYWALQHAPARPDFHDPAGFILEV